MQSLAEMQEEAEKAVEGRYAYILAPLPAPGASSWTQVVLIQRASAVAMTARRVPVSAYAWWVLDPIGDVYIDNLCSHDGLRLATAHRKTIARRRLRGRVPDPFLGHPIVEFDAASPAGEPSLEVVMQALRAAEGLERDAANPGRRPPGRPSTRPAPPVSAVLAPPAPALQDSIVPVEDLPVNRPVVGELAGDDVRSGASTPRGRPSTLGDSHLPPGTSWVVLGDVEAGKLTKTSDFGKRGEAVRAKVEGTSADDIFVNEFYPGLVSLGHTNTLAQALLPAEVDALAADGETEDSLDARVLAVHRIGSRRFLRFADAVAKMEWFDFGDDVLEGPPACEWFLLEVVRSGLGLVARHRAWVTDARIPAGDRSVYEHFCLCKIIETACEVDQLNVSTLFAFELAVRRLMVIEQAHMLSPSNPDYSCSEDIMGWGVQRGGALVAPRTIKHAAERAKERTAVLKETRLARAEAKARGQKGKNGKKDGGADDDE